MRLKKFEARNVHGFLNFKVAFFSDLTFITGENGGGKTTLVNSLAALIAPNFEVLCNVEFEWMKILLEHEKKDVEINAEKSDDSVRLRVSGVDAVLEITKFIANVDEPIYNQNERERDYYRTLIASNSDNQVMKFISSLPDPMFLDIDRRARASQERTSSVSYSRNWNRSRNVFSAYLTQSLRSAASLVEDKYRQFLLSDRGFTEELRKSLILGQFDKSALENHEFARARLPTMEDRKLVSSIRDLSNTLPDLLNLSQSEVKAKIEPFLKRVESDLKRIPEDLTWEQVRDGKNFRKWFTKAAKWMAVAPSVQSFAKVIEEVKKYTAKRDTARKDFDDFLILVNKFLNSGGKEIQFDKTGQLAFKISDLPETRPIGTLSSGEAQIFVILSHLMFNPQADKANVFIVDEPELSLHILWQELFVSSILSANPRIQFILATHSPSIIQDRTKSCRSGFSNKRRK